MRAVKAFLAASGFITYFMGMMALSAFTTSAVHSAFNPRALPTAFARD
jgi:hypothetical protein